MNKVKIFAHSSQKRLEEEMSHFLKDKEIVSMSSSQDVQYNQTIVIVVYKEI